MFLVGDPYKPSFATVTGRGTTQVTPQKSNMDTKKWPCQKGVTFSKPSF